MSTSTESNPPAKGAATATGSATASTPPQDSAPGRSAPSGSAPGPSRGGSGAASAKGLSSLDEMNLEKSILRRGLATQQELDYCKAQRAKLAASSDSAPGLLEVMIAAKALTQTQARRLLSEIGETQKKLDVPGYQIIDKIGKGSMGMVYKARQLSVDRVVALKVLLDALAKNKEFIKRFQFEAKNAARLSHNNIVGVIDAGEVGGHHYFVMEYVEGGTIKDPLDKGEVFEERNALKIITAVAEALKHAHLKGLIHRDIKPENIILPKDGGVKLADLGLARPTADEKWAMAEAGMAIGTPYYISPEQVRGQIDVDIRADIYSLGATFYHMVTGRVPHDGETPADVMRKHVDKNTPIVPPDHINTKLSGGVGEVIETMMAKNRENRYRTPDDLLLDLQCLLRGERPMIAEQKASSLAKLAEGDISEDEAQGPGIPEAEMMKLAGMVKSRTNTVVVVAALLALSVLSNLALLVMH